MQIECVGKNLKDTNCLTCKELFITPLSLYFNAWQPGYDFEVGETLQFLLLGILTSAPFLYYIFSSQSAAR